MARLWLWLALILSALAAACGSSDSTSARLLEIQVTPASSTVSIGGAQQFSATGRYSDGASKDLVGSVTWTSLNSAVATITSGGLATGKAAGSSSIVATASSITGSATLTVTGPVLVSIAVTPSAPSVAVGSTLQFTATGSYNDGSKKDVTTSVEWASSVTSVATISDSGRVQCEAVGKSTITATSGSVSGTATLTVTAAMLTSVTVTPADSSIPLGILQPFTAIGTYSDGTTKDISSKVIWNSSRSTVASITSVGIATARNLGNTKIQAVLDGVSGTTDLNVNAASLSTITIVDGNVTIAENTSRQLTAIGLFNDGGTRNISTNVTWTSSEQEVATMPPHNPVVKGIAPGSTTITATLNAVSGSVMLNVTNARIQFMSVTPASPAIAPATNVQFVATATFNDATTQNLTLDAIWSSSNPHAATIASTGVATGVEKGSTGITAHFGGVTGSATLSVSDATLTAIAITPPIAVIAPASTQPFTATGTFSNTTKQILSTVVTWGSSDTTVATITGFGFATGLRPGNTQIRAELGPVSAPPAALLVTSSPLRSIAIAPALNSVPRGIRVSFIATGTFEDLTTQNVTSAATWTSTPSSIASISNDLGTQGVATGLTPGQATITAVFAGFVGTSTLHVSNATLTSIIVAPAATDVAAGAKVQFTATGHFSDGTTLALTTQVAWASSDATVAVISPIGLASTVETGLSKSTTIRASLNGVSGTASLSVH